MFFASTSQTKIFTSNKKYGLLKKNLLQVIFFILFQFLNCNENARKTYPENLFNNKGVFKFKSEEIDFKWKNLKEDFLKIKDANEKLLTNVLNSLKYNPYNVDSSKDKLKNYLYDALKSCTTTLEITAKLIENIQKHPIKEELNSLNMKLQAPMENFFDFLDELIVYNFNFSNACNNYLNGDFESKNLYGKKLEDITLQISNTGIKILAVFATFVLTFCDFKNIELYINGSNLSKNRFIERINTLIVIFNKYTNEDIYEAQKIKETYEISVLEISDKLKYQLSRKKTKSIMAFNQEICDINFEKIEFVISLTRGSLISISKVNDSKKQNIIKLEIEEIENSLLSDLKDLTEADIKLIKESKIKILKLSMECIEKLSGMSIIRNVMSLWMRFLAILPNKNFEGAIPLRLLKVQLERIIDCRILADVIKKLTGLNETKKVIKIEDMDAFKNNLIDLMNVITRRNEELKITIDLIDSFYIIDDEDRSKYEKNKERSAPANSKSGSFFIKLIIIIFVVVAITTGIDIYKRRRKRTTTTTTYP